jgi:hypothetical protein
MWYENTTLLAQFWPEHDEATPKALLQHEPAHGLNPPAETECECASDIPSELASTAAAVEAHAHSPNFARTAEYGYCEGAGGWVEYAIAPVGTEHDHAQLAVRYASADPRPVRVLVDGVVVGEACELSTAGWDGSDAEWHASMPFRVDWSQPHVLRLETDAFFPHVAEYALVPCQSASAAAQREHLARLLDAALGAGKSDIDKAACLVATLKEALFGRMKGMRSLQVTAATAHRIRR